MRHFLLALLAFVAGCFSGHAADYRVSSPSGNIVLTVSNGDKLSYSVTWNGRAAIAPSAMGFEFKGEKPMAGPFTVLGNPCVEAHMEAWKPVVANKYSDISVASKSLTLQLKETADEGRRMDLEFRVMDDGVAFRYTLYPVTRVGDRMVQRELTEFAVPAGTEGWMTEYPRPFRSSQEAWRTRTPLASVPDSQITGLPLLLKADDDLYLAITEAAMDNWSGFYLGVGKTAGGVCTLETHLSPLPWEEPESWANLKKYEEGVKVRFDDVIRSSWRLVMIADNPGRFIESEAIHSLNEPCAIEDPSWIKPGLSAWDHWWSGEVKVDMPTIKEYIDFASQMGWPYMLIDWQWYGPYAQPNADITKAAPQLLALDPFRRHRPEQRLLRRVPDLPRLGHRRRQDRLHGPGGPGDGTLVPESHRTGGGMPVDGRFPRRLQARRHRPDLAQHDDAGRRAGQRILQVCGGPPAAHARA